MHPSGRLIAVLCLVGLGGCMHAAGGPGVGFRSPDTSPTGQGSGQTSAYGLFLAGQAAVNAGHGSAAASYFDRAAELNAGPNRGADASLLASRAFSASLLGGDIRRATALATTAAAQPAADPGVAGLAMLTRGVEALADGEPARARVLLSAGSAAGDRLAPAALLAPIAAAEAGDAKGAAIHPVIADDPISQFYASLDQARLYEHFHRYDEAETAYRALVASSDPGGLASYNLGLFLERRGRASEASGVYDRALSRNPDDRALVAARARLASGRRPPPLISLREMAAESLAAPAALLMVKKQEEAALAFLRLALRLDPADDDAWALVGDVLADLGDVDAARAAWLTPRPGSDSFAAARAKLAWSYQNAGATDEALKIARAALAAAPGNLDSATNLADLLRASQRYDDSIRVLDPLIAGEAGQPDWRLLYMRAVDYQESGRWADAERDLSRALVLRPDEPELLNFLGYSWIDRGERLPQALDMIKKAVSLEPRSGAMLDSLGWGYYRLGDYPMAVRELESAVALEAGDPDINDHLGDAYWRVGRVTEARYQWRRVLTLEPSAKLRSQAEAKLKSGLGGVAPAVVAGP